MGKVGKRLLLAAFAAALIPACGGSGGDGSGTTGQAGWGLPTLLETQNAGNAQNPEVAVDPAGNATVVWHQRDGARLDVWSNRYDQATQTWGVAQLIETDDVSNAVNPHVAVDPAGNVTAVWQQHDGTRSNIMSNRYDPTSGTWGTPVLVETNDVGSALFPEVAVDPSGSAIAAWYQDGDPSAATRRDIWANRYDQGSGTWGTAVLIETDDVGDAYLPQVGVDSNGNAVVVWHQDGDPTVNVRFDIWANRYDHASGTWGTAQLLETDDAGDAEFVDVAMDRFGNATAAWNQFDGTNNNILWNRYDQVSGTWGTAQLLETDDTGWAYDVSVAVDPIGNVTAVWEHDDGTTRDIVSNRYDQASGTWGTPVDIETNNAGRAHDPDLAVDPDGNVTAVWTHNDGTYYHIWSNRYDALSGTWGTPVLIEMEGFVDSLNPKVAVDASGYATAVWYQDGDPTAGTRLDIWANRYE